MTSPTCVVADHVNESSTKGSGPATFVTVNVSPSMVFDADWPVLRPFRTLASHLYEVVLAGQSTLSDASARAATSANTARNPATNPTMDATAMRRRVPI
jgi:hypothetical protein